MIRLPYLLIKEKCMSFKKHSLIILSLFFISVGVLAERNVTVLDTGWKFINKEIRDAELLNFDDSCWEVVDVPHDWAIDKPFDMNHDKQWVQVIEDGESEARLRTGRTGALPIFGVGWYRKELTINQEDAGKRVYAEFDGAMSLAKIYVNGTYVGEWPYGYSSFSFDITENLIVGGKNILAVRLENKPESSRWYSGAGIYRHVRLIKVHPVHVAHWGTYITTPKISKRNAEVNIKTEINRENFVGPLTLTTVLFDNEGKEVARQRKSLSTEDRIVEQKLTVRNPKLWSLEETNLYKAQSILSSGSVVLDVYDTNFGIRSIEYNRTQGFLLNGEVVKMKGVCMHHDLGPIGAAVNHRAMERQLEMLKEMGSNAIRTAHNPPDPYLLELADKMGFLVQVEAFDEWKMGKNKHGYHTLYDAWAEKDLRAMIRRDRNHPSVVMWSIGNEMREQWHKKGEEITRYLVDICKDEDPTRPVTAGFSGHIAAIKNGLTDHVDLVGFNYKPYDYKVKYDENPEYIIYGSETSSTVSSRGVYKFPVKEAKEGWHWDYHSSSYDLEYPKWASTPDTEFAAQDDNEFVFGEFVWTGFDYLGEPTPYNEGTPAKSSYFGIIDLAGLKKDRFYLYQSRWSEQPVLHLLPHWNWPDREGKKVPVFCYTNYPKAELFVNGVSQGVKSKDTSPDNTNIQTRYRLMWEDVIYKPGEIKVVAYDNQGNAVEEKAIKTAGEPYSINITVDREEIVADGKDLSFVTVEILDKDNNVCPRADNLLFFDVQGKGTLKALCNGDPTDLTAFSSNYMRTFSGKLVAVIQAGLESGSIELTVSSKGLKQSEKIITSK